MAEVYSGFGYGYKGNLHIKCWHCGAELDFYSRKELDSFFCRECGKKTSLDDLKTCFLNCECGNRTKYYTNEQKAFDVECYTCKQPVAMFPVRTKGKRNIFMSAYSLEQLEEKRKRR